MTEVEKKAAVIMAVTDKIQHGEGAKPSGYWGVVPMPAAHELDAKMKDMSQQELAGVLDRLVGEMTMAGVLDRLSGEVV